MPSKELIIPKYCESTHQTRRRPTRTVNVSAAGSSQQPARVHAR